MRYLTLTGIVLLLYCLDLGYALSEKPIRYSPDWKSIDSRPLPKWYDSAKVGIFIHWGVFSVPGFGDFKHAGEWFWWYWQGQKMPGFQNFMKKNYPPNFHYADFARSFKAELFNPDEWADLFRESGARYVVLTSKHHEGFCNWNTSVSFNWNSVEAGPGVDLVQRLADSVRRRTNITFGLYHSLFEWFNPLFLQDQSNGFKTQSFVREKTMPGLYEIVNRYKPDVIWSDGDWGAKDTYWNSTEFLAWLYNDSPVRDNVVVNDRWGSGTGCKHGGFYTCQDRYNPGRLVNHKWENCFTLDRYSWGFRHEMAAVDIMSMEEVLSQLVSTVSCGGNVLINVGPTAQGTIAPIFQQRLLELGQWLKVNGEAIYDSKPWKAQNDSLVPGVWYTTRNSVVYVMVLKYPAGGLLKLGSLRLQPAPAHTEVTLLGYYGPSLQVTRQPNSTLIQMPCAQMIRSKWAWTLSIHGAL